MNLCLRLNAVAVLFLCYVHGTNGQQHIEIIVERKIKDYGQNLTLFCKIENCCQKPAGWNIGVFTLFLDIKWINPLKGFINYPTYRATYDAKGIRLIIQNFSTSDLNRTHECVYGYDQTSMTLLYNDVFSNNTSQDNDQGNDVNKTLELILLYILIPVVIVIIVVAVVSLVICCILMRRRGKKPREFLPCCLKSSRKGYKNIDQTEMQPPLPNDAKQNQTEKQPPLPNDAKQNQTEMQPPLPNDAKQNDDMCLSDEEKTMMLKKYVTNITEETVNKCLESSKSCGFFPLLCTLCEGKQTAEVLTLFSNPISSIKEHMAKMKNHNDEIKLHALALCVLFDNHFEEEWIIVDKAPQSLQHRLKGFFSKVNKINPKGEKNTIIATILEDLLGTYLKKIGNCYSFADDKLFDIAGVVCGKNMFQMFIENASSHFIGDRYWLESNSKSCFDLPSKKNIDAEIDENRIIVKKVKENNYFKRVVSDLQNLDYYSFINNSQLGQDHYRRKLMKYLNEHKEYVVSSLNKIQCNENEFPERTPLWQAIRLGYYEIAEFLITEIEFNVNSTNENRKSLLHIACENQSQGIVELLLRKQADVSKCDKDERSPLHYACRKGNVQIVELLIKNKTADILKCDKDGNSSLELAKKSGNQKLVELLNANLGQMKDKARLNAVVLNKVTN